RRMNSEQHDQQRRHQRAAAHARHADQKADGKTRKCVQWINHRRLFARPGTTDTHGDAGSSTLLQVAGALCGAAGSGATVGQRNGAIPLRIARSFPSQASLVLPRAHARLSTGEESLWKPSHNAGRLAGFPGEVRQFWDPRSAPFWWYAAV